MKTALVTGAGRGLGAGLARRLGADGWAVAIHFRSSAHGAEAVARDIRAEGGRAEVFQADLGQLREAHGVADAVADRFGQLDLLVNNSGVYHPSSIDEITEEEWCRELASTATATFFMTRAALPLLRRAKGRVVNIGDSACDRPGARDMALGYHVGKAGVAMLTRSFARAEAGHGVAVNMVSPGFLENSVGLAPDLPAGRPGTFDEVWWAVKAMAEAPAHLTGSHLVVSGGWNL